jgi:hypothetical protein
MKCPKQDAHSVVQHLQCLGLDHIASGHQVGSSIRAASMTSATKFSSRWGQNGSRTSLSKF